MKVLAIDTSTYTLGVALSEGEQVLGEYITTLNKNHSLRVMPAIEALMKECDVKPADLEKIVVAKGPGSYTGVRIGVTIAKTLAWSLNIPLASVSSLAVLAAAARFAPAYIAPLLDARRGRVYTGLYRLEDGKLENVKEDQNIALKEWCCQLEELDQEVLFTGPDVLLHKEVIQELLGNRALLKGDFSSSPRPSDLLYLGLNEPAVDLHSFVPNYIRLAEAETKWLEQQKAEK